MKIAKLNHRHHLLLLLLWTAIGLILRFLNLTLKPLWTDEFSTIVFSLGHSFLSIPLNQPLTADQLLQPLQVLPRAGVSAVIQHLSIESNHPPLYFILSHFWLKLFPTENGLVSSGAVRSLSALFGALSVPASFGLGWLAFRSRLVGHLAAAFMAVSPFGIYLAQEARHYTLPVLWVMASLSCLVMASRSIRDRTALPLWLCLIWIGVNGLGLATHYLFALTLTAEALVIVLLGLVQSWQERGIWYPAWHWQRIGLVVIGTIATAAIWLPFLPDVPDSELTRWVYRNDWSNFGWFDPILQAIAGWITMLYLLPIQAPSKAIVIGSGLLLVLITLWTLPKLYWGLRVQMLERGDRRMAVRVLGAFVGTAILTLFGLVYGLGADLTSAFRYNFIYFPAVMILVGAALASGWTAASTVARLPGDRVPAALVRLMRVNGRKTIGVLWCLSLIGALTVVSDLGYQKTHRPDVVAQAIWQNSGSSNPVLIALPHQHHGQTGRLMGIALELQRQAPKDNPAIDRFRFLLAHQTQAEGAVIAALQQSLAQRPRPLDLWLINMQTVSEEALKELLKQQSCEAEAKTKAVDGYRYRLYRCQ